MIWKITTVTVTTLIFSNRNVPYNAGIGSTVLDRFRRQCSGGEHSGWMCVQKKPREPQKKSRRSKLQDLLSDTTAPHGILSIRISAMVQRSIYHSWRLPYHLDHTLASTEKCRAEWCGRSGKVCITELTTQRLGWTHFIMKLYSLILSMLS